MAATNFPYNIPDIPPPPLLFLTSELKEKSAKQAKTTLFQILSKRLIGTIFFQEAPALDALRHALGDSYIPLLPDGSENYELLDKFFSHVSPTTYEDYQPFVTRLLDKECPKFSDVNNLLSPGLPAYITHSSGTSGGRFKHFPKYPDSGPVGVRWDTPDVPGVKLYRFILLSLNHWKHVFVDDNTVQDIPVCVSSTATVRFRWGIGPMEDAKIIDKKADFMTSPFAVMLLPWYKTNIFMATLFALTDPSLSIMQAAFSTSIHDTICTLEEHWDTMINAIQLGVLPDIYDLGEYRPHIERHFKSHPGRAQELRKIEKGEEGWLKRVWPSLTVVNATFSGIYATLLPKLRHHFGPSVLLRSVRYGATEARVGCAYGGNDTNLYRLVSNSYTEFLDVGKEGIPENFVQPWQVEVGKKYEVIVTTNNGLWRYQLNDIVEIAGFTPAEGIPLFRYIERKGVGFRICGEFICESFLRDIMGSLTNDTLGRVLEFTTVPDGRKRIRAYGFFVELEGEIGILQGLNQNTFVADPAPLLGRDPSRALTIIKEKLLTDKGYKSYSDGIGDPTIRILKPGTFKEYRHWRAETGGINAGQIKVPTMLIDPATLEWLAERVVIEV